MKTFKLKLNPAPPERYRLRSNRVVNGLEEQQKRATAIKKSLAKEGWAYVGLDAEGFDTWQKEGACT